MAPRKATTKKRKTKVQPKFQYLEQQMVLAIAELQQKNISVREVANKYNVPKSTLNNKARGFYPAERKMGPKTKPKFWIHRSAQTSALFRKCPENRRRTTDE